MKENLLLFSCAATLALASCSQEKAAETTTTTTTTETGSAPATEGTYRTRANRIAARMATDLKITDTTVVARAEDIYFNRSRRLADLQAQYATDTTGLYTAMQAINTETDTQFKTIFSEPAQYEAYVANRMNYAEQMYVEEAPAPTSAAPTADQGETKIEADGDMKTKYADGTKVKTESDGEMKIKTADGSKVKVDDDGEIKMKEE